jgi:hypothetical protein
MIGKSGNERASTVPTEDEMNPIIKYTGRKARIAPWRRDAVSYFRAEPMGALDRLEAFGLEPVADGGGRPAICGQGVDGLDLGHGRLYGREDYWPVCV